MLNNTCARSVNKMNFGITLLLLTCLTTTAAAAWFEYKPSKQKKVQQLNDGQTGGEKSPRYQVSRTSTGPVVIASVDPDGKFIMLENTSSGPNRRDVNLEGWGVERVIDGGNKYKYTFRKYTLKAAKRLKIYGRGFAAQARIGDAVMYDQTSWGTGNNTTTVLLNDKGEVRESLRIEPALLQTHIFKVLNGEVCEGKGVTHKQNHIGIERWIVYVRDPTGIRFLTLSQTRPGFDIPNRKGLGKH